jgi:HAE1 family hydrophobic/amphiphilic exporter-1
VEFAVQRRQEGLSLLEAAVEGGKLRFRPIQMTSFAFIAGLLPLVVATGAGAIGNRTIGTTAAGGMLVGTVVGVLIIPGLYYMFGRLADGRKLLQDEVDQPLSEVFERHALEPHAHEADSLPFDAGFADPTHHHPTEFGDPSHAHAPSDFPIPPNPYAPSEHAPPGPEHPVGGTEGHAAPELDQPPHPPEGGGS